MSATRRLQLVPDSDSSTSAKAFADRQFETIDNAREIFSILSLYFEWPQHRSCRIYNTLGDNFACELDRDRDEIDISELRIRLNNDFKVASFSYGLKIQIFFQLFRKTYSFTSTVTAIASDPEQEGWHLITETPTDLKLISARTLPRIVLTDESRANLPPALWVANGKSTLVNIVEMGLKSMKAEHEGQIEGAGVIRLGDQDFKAEVFKSDSGDSVFVLNLVDAKKYGAYFDIFRRVAYPNLRSRYDLPYEASIDLYRRSNYHGNADVKLDDISGELIETWKAIKSGVHETTADYLVVNQDGLPVGSSGLALTHFANEIPMWTFHQACAVKDPNTVWLSGELYTWRAEYLFGRSELFETWFTFRSSSRWVERIYVKHSMNSKSGVKLDAMKMMRCHFEINNSEIDKIDRIEIGLETRYSVTEKGIYGGAGPEFLNASNYLNCVVAMFGNSDLNIIKDLGGRLAELTGRKNGQIAISVPRDQETNGLDSKPLAPDRYCEFAKGLLGSFISSVEHSMAVTEKKLNYVGT